MTDMNYYTAQSTYMEPDVYAGDTCDQVRPRWVAYIEKEGRCDVGELIELNAKTFPAGTRILIQIPDCPECTTSADLASDGKCECGFDWDQWTQEQYS